jgi:acyl-CoA synthetase (NDP forming)
MRNSLTESLDCLFNPASVAVIGASSAPNKWGYEVIAKLTSASPEARIFPINRNGGEILGQKVYRQLSEVPGSVDLAIIVIPPEAVVVAMEECVKKGVNVAVIISAGFKETGQEGSEIESAVLKIARGGGIRIVGPNCNGHFNTAARLFTNNDRAGVSFGTLSLISQSGNFGGYILEKGESKHVGFSKYVSSGNESDLSFEDYLEYLAEDPKTEVICAYIEGLKDGKRFFDLGRKITQKKPIVVMKVGRSTEGAQAARSHTGSLAGSDNIHDAVFRQSGIIRVNEVDDLLDTALALRRQPLPKGRRVAIVTVGGGFGVVATDACRRYGLEVPSLSEETVRTLDKYLPPRWSRSNPVDMAGSSEGSYGCIGNLLNVEDIDAIMAVGSIGFPMRVYPDPQYQEFVNKMMENELKLVDGLIERIDRYQKPVIVAAPILGGKSPVIAKLEEKDFYSCPTPEAGAKVIHYLVQRAEYLKNIR